MKPTALLLACLLVAPALTSAQPASLPNAGSHIVAHTWTRDGSDPGTLAFGVDRLDGAPVLRVYYEDGLINQDGRFWATDGNALIELPWRVQDHWHRIDAVLHGSTLALHFNLRESVALDAITPATEGVPSMEENYGPGNPTDRPIHWTRIRVDNDDLARETTFTQPLPHGGWHVHNEGGYYRLRPSSWGDKSDGYIEMGSDSLGLTYVYTDIMTIDGRYTAEASFAPDASLLPAYQAVLAGLSGPRDDPEVQWSITMQKVPSGPYHWGLFFHDGVGMGQKVSPTYTNGHFRSVAAVVDADGGYITIDSQHGDPITIESPSLNADFIGVGDVGQYPIGIPTGFVAKFDDLAVYEVAG